MDALDAICRRRGIDRANTLKILVFEERDRNRQSKSKKYLHGAPH